jgi:Zn-dependent M28 family amino/carboxypeptidase
VTGLRAVLAAVAGVTGAVGAATCTLTQPVLVPDRPTAAVAAAAAAVDPARLEQHVRALSEQFHPRSFDQPEMLDAAADHVREALRATGAVVHEQAYLHEGERWRNVVARFGPRAGPLLVIGAHYDSHGDAPRRALDESRPLAHTHTPGADDNASGVAGLIELARVLATQPVPRPVELVAYTLEEPPFFRSDAMGSMRHARALAEAGTEVELMISLEMIGFFSDAPGSQRYPLPGLHWLYPSHGDFIAVVGRLQDIAATRALKASMLGAAALPVRSINAVPALVGVDFSDHLSYWRHGYPALMVTDTAFLRNDQYHRAGDTADRLDYRRMAEVVQGVAAFALRPVAD